MKIDKTEQSLNLSDDQSLLLFHNVKTENNANNSLYYTTHLQTTAVTLDLIGMIYESLYNTRNIYHIIISHMCFLLV